jgi:hypothetical protein
LDSLDNRRITSGRIFRRHTRHLKKKQGKKTLDSLDNRRNSGRIFDRHARNPENQALECRDAAYRHITLV